MMRRGVCALLLGGLLAAGCGREAKDHRVLVLGFDGLDPGAIDLLMSEGQMPNFARMRQEGAYGRLLSAKPLLSPVVWTTIATGKTPDQHGIGHFVAVGASGEQFPVTSHMRKVKALWNIASEMGKRVVVVGWWATWPPEVVDGVIVSDHAAYHFLFEDGFTGGADDAKTYPPELAERIAPLLRRPDDLSFEEARPFVNVSQEELSAPFGFEDDLAHFKWALATMKSYRDIAIELWRSERPDLQLVYFEGTDSISHLFGHLFRAQGLAGELARQQERFGQAVEEVYRYADSVLGELMAEMDDDTSLLVMSDHGFRLGDLHDDPSRTRDLRRVSERFHTEQGILYAYGAGIKAYTRIDRPRTVDVAPTALALLGLPAARDMAGRVLAEALSPGARPGSVGSYEGSVGIRGRPQGRDPSVDEAVRAHLESLGYLGGDASSPQGDRNLAAVHFQTGRYEEAARIYQRLVEENPDDAALLASLAGVLGAMGRYEEAERTLLEAIRLEPLNPEAYHNLGVIAERRGDPAGAAELYRTAVRYSPRYEPSSAALLRLTGTAEVEAPSTDAERRAALLAEEASLAARRGDYSSAMQLLDQAQRIAPEYPLIHQYRSNVAYLMGDLQAAIAALETGLELEPDNALFRENLKRLRSDAGQ